MKSKVVKCFLDIKLNITLSESRRKKLRVLNLRCHRLDKCPNLRRRFPPEYLDSLKCLHMQHNVLTILPRSYCHSLRNLKAMTLDYNRLYDLPFDLRHFKNLTILNVSYNKFSDGHFFLSICQITTLKVLWANATGIKEIPIEITALKKLQTLGVRHNNIHYLPEEISSLANLKWLTLSNNSIGSLPARIGDLKSLVHLNVSYNHLVSVPTTLVMLQELQYLHLNHNFLIVDGYLRCLISNIPKLVKCFLHANLRQGSDREEYIDEIIGLGGDSAGLTPWSVSRPSSPTEIQSGGNFSSSATSRGVEESILRERLEGVYGANHGIQETLNNSYVKTSDNDGLQNDVNPCKRSKEYEYKDGLQYLYNNQKEVVETDSEIVTVYKNQSQFSKSSPICSRDSYGSDTSDAVGFDKEDDDGVKNNDENLVVAFANAHNVPSVKSPDRKLYSEIFENDVNDNNLRHQDILENEKNVFPSKHEAYGGVQEKPSSFTRTDEAWSTRNSHTNLSDNTHSVQEPQNNFDWPPSEPLKSEVLKKIEEVADTIIGEAVRQIQPVVNKSVLSMIGQLEDKKSSLISTSSTRNSEPKIIPGLDNLMFHCRRSQSNIVITPATRMTSMITQISLTRHQQINGDDDADAEYSLINDNDNNTVVDNETNKGSSSSMSNNEPDENNNAANFIQTQKLGSISEGVPDIPCQPDSDSPAISPPDEGSNIGQAVSLYGTDSMSLQININNSITSSLSLGLDFVDIESNYDPSDWENSTPSSIIDDQDIISRFSDFQDAVDDGELEDEYPNLEDTDLRGIIRCLISIF